MLQRTLVPLFLLTLLLTQALSGVCRLRCDHLAATTQSPSCHSMPMADEAPKQQASAPCATHSCPTGEILLAGNTPQQDVPSPQADSPHSSLPEALRTLNLPSTTQALAPPALPPPVPQATLRKTSLRV